MQIHVYVEVDRNSTKEGLRTYGYVIEAANAAGKVLKAVEKYGEVFTTSRGAQIAAAADALERFDKATTVHLHMADWWVLTSITGALGVWAANGFMRSDGKEIRYREHWERLNRAKAGHLVVPEPERHSAWSERLSEGIQKHMQEKVIRDV